MQSSFFTTHSSLLVLRHSFLLILTAVYLLGQVCAAWGWFVCSPVWLGGFLLLIAALWSYGERSSAALIGCFLLAFSFANSALQRVIAPQFPPHHLRHLPLPQQLLVEGWLFREPEHLPNRGRLYLEALRVWQNGEPHPVVGKVLVTVRSLSGSWQYGDVLRAPLRLRRPRNFHTPGSFDYEGYLARQGIYLSAFLWDDMKIEPTGRYGSAVRFWIENVRRTIGAFFDTHLDRQTAAVLRALIIGDEGGISKDLREAFSRAGVAHVLSISGLHISLVAAVSYGTWWWLLGRSRSLLLTFILPKLAALFTVLPVILYASLSGGNVATWRSVIMVLVYLAAILMDRQGELYRSLALAALAILLLWPGSVLDISFQLSFLSVLSIFLGMGRFSIWWERLRESLRLHLYPKYERVLHWGATYVAVSAYALLGTAPVTAAHFNQIALVGLFANLIVVPLLGSAAVILGLAAAGLSFLHHNTASFILFGAGFVTQAGIWLVEQIGAWHFAALHVVTPTFLELGVVYGLLACLTFRSSIRHSFPTLRYLSLVLLVILFVDSVAWMWHRYLHRELRISFLDVGQGDATVVELPGSQVMVIDGGGFASEDFDVGEAILAPFLWSRKIGRVDILVMSHPQLDHYGGLAYLAKHFSAREFWFNGENARGERFEQLLTTLREAGVPSVVLCNESPERWISGIRIQILHPPCQRSGLDTNNASLVLRLSHGEVDALFTGDIEKDGEEALLSTNKTLASEILKVPHHGSRTSSSLALLDAVSPQMAVASLGSHNRFHFPASEVIRRYAEKGSVLLQTDRVGTVTVISNRQTWHLETTHPSAQEVGEEVATPFAHKKKDASLSP